MEVLKAKQAIKALVSKVYDLIDPSGYNTDAFVKMVDGMSDTAFKQWIAQLESGEARLTIEMPNMVSRMSVEKLLKAAELTETKLFQQIVHKDISTGIEYETPHKYPILELPIRRTQQVIEKKMRIPGNDNSIDAMTGQVSSSAKASAIGKEEIQILYNRGLENVLKEFLQVRGGDPELFAKMVQQLEETGQADVDTDDPMTKTRVSETVNTLFAGMQLETNF
jgi:hypothetical protein